MRCTVPSERAARSLLTVAKTRSTNSGDGVLELEFDLLFDGLLFWALLFERVFEPDEVPLVAAGFCSAAGVGVGVSLGFDAGLIALGEALEAMIILIAWLRCASVCADGWSDGANALAICPPVVALVVLYAGADEPLFGWAATMTPAPAKTIIVPAMPYTSLFILILSSVA